MYVTKINVRDLNSIKFIGYIVTAWFVDYMQYLGNIISY